MWAIVPVKPFPLAKQRLAGLLDARERADLSEAMLGDVLTALGATPGIDRVLLVTRDARARALAARLGASVHEERAEGLVPAVTEGARAAAEAGARGAMIVPGDLPLATADAFAAVLAAHGTGRGVTLVADDEDDGTNCLLCTPADGIVFRFGRRSRAAHVEAARAAGLEVREVDVPALALDIDTPADLRALCAGSRGGPATLAFVEAAGLASRVDREGPVGSRSAGRIAGERA